MTVDKNLHADYLQLSFRPVVNVDGSLSRIGVRNDGPICYDPEVFGHLLTAAPVLYQMLSAVRDGLSAAGADTSHIELALVFAQGGYSAINGVNIADIIKAVKK